jgi:hypothetical protein
MLAVFLRCLALLGGAVTFTCPSVSEKEATDPASIHVAARHPDHVLTSHLVVELSNSNKELLSPVAELG